MNAKKKCLLFEGKQKDNLEELMVSFLKNTVLPIWPEGWMYLNTLKKVYNSMTDTSKFNNVTQSSKVLDSNVNKSNTNKSNVNKADIDQANTERSAPPIEKSVVDGTLNTIAPKHSNLTIIPVDVKTSTTKPEVTNSVTVTKISHDVTTDVIKMSETTLPSTQMMQKMYEGIMKAFTLDTPTTKAVSSANEQKVRF